MKRNQIAILFCTATIVTSTVADIKISAGRYHTLINDNGLLSAVGSNQYLESGQTADISRIFSPLPIDLPSSVVDMDASLVRSIVSLANGDVYLFGYRLEIGKVDGFSNVTKVEVNDLGAYILINGEVFFGWSLDRSNWVKIEGLTNIDSISARGKHMLAVDVNQSVFEVTEHGYANYIEGLPPITKAVAGEFHSMFIDSDSQLWTMGEDSNGYGKLGLGFPGGSEAPKMVPNGENVIDVDGGKIQTIVAKMDGTVWAAGWHNYIPNTQIPSDHVYNKSDHLIQIYELSGVLDVESGDDALYAATFDTMYSWGGGMHGKLGTGSETELHQPMRAYSSLYESNSDNEVCNNDYDNISQQVEIPVEVIIEKEVIRTVEVPRNLTFEELLVLVKKISQQDNDKRKAIRKQTKITSTQKTNEFRRFTDHDRGHGNDLDKFDEDNPGKKIK